MGRKVAIVAKAGTSALAPWDDLSWEIWGLPWIKYQRVDCLFEIHTQAMVDESDKLRSMQKTWHPHYLKNCRDALVYCDKTREHLFKRVAHYPLEDVCKSVPVPFLENSVSYQLALAIHECVDEIGLYGVHMVASREYMLERASVLYLVGLAQGRGIKVHIPDGCPLFMSAWLEGRYGVSHEKRMLPR